MSWPGDPMHVAFVNENTLGHGSYLPPFVRHFRERPELGIAPHPLDATPLPPALSRWADTSVRGLRGWGLDFHVARWRRVVSAHVRTRLDELRRRGPLDAVVVNTQSVGLALVETAAELPVFVCADATFEQLARSAWFAPNAASRLLLPLTLSPIRGAERALFRAARGIFAWSEPVRESLRADYGVPAERILRLPPSVEPPPAGMAREARDEAGRRPRILFVGGDFRRKGGAVLLEAFRRRFADSCELHLVTQSPVPPEPGVHVHRGIVAHTPAWRELWEGADVFVFPSTLETFGIVLLEALAFGVPVVAADVGAARDVLAGGRAGVLVERVDADTLGEAIAAVLADPGEAGRRAALGRARVEAEFTLSGNAERLAARLHGAAREGGVPAEAGARAAHG